MMKIISAQCTISAVRPNQYPDTGYPEIVVVGRSNVGKSSLINSLCARRTLARTSCQPGKTQTINYFKINNRYYFVDLPGYGYAKVSKKMRAQWRTLIESYLSGSEQIRCVVVIIDARHEVPPLDLQMLRWLREMGIPPLVVATKVDKLSSSELATKLGRNVSALSEFGVEAVFPFSAVTGYGKKQVLQAIFDKLIVDSEQID